MEEELPFNRRDHLNERPPVETGSGRGSHLSLLIEKKLREITNNNQNKTQTARERRQALMICSGEKDFY